MTLDTRLHLRAEDGRLRALLLCGLLALGCALPSKEPACRDTLDCRDPGLACVDGHCRAPAAGGDGAVAMGSGGSAGALDDAGPKGTGGGLANDAGGDG